MTAVHVLKSKSEQNTENVKCSRLRIQCALTRLQKMCKRVSLSTCMYVKITTQKEFLVSFPKIQTLLLSISKIIKRDSILNSPKITFKKKYSLIRQAKIIV